MKPARKAMAMMISPEIHSNSNSNDDTPDARLSSDRLSGLQESIIYHIFSFLGANDTVRLSLVSRKFKGLCLNSPFLFFVADFDDSVQFPYFKRTQLRERYFQFCNYVDKVMRSRHDIGIEIDRFFIQWVSKEFINEGCSVIAPWVKAATECNVIELDILFKLGFGIYYLPESVFGCQSLRVLRLNLQNGRFNLADRGMESVEELVLDSVTISDRYFGQKISNCWASLKRLNLVNVSWMCSLNIESKSLEELTISEWHWSGQVNADWRWSGYVNFDWRLTIASLSLKSINISRGHFAVPCQIILDCPSLENFTVRGCQFDKVLMVKIVPHSPQRLGIFESDFSSFSARLQSFGIFGSYFKKPCIICISCPSVKHIKISRCNFEELCRLKIHSTSLEDLTISDCELISSQKKFSNSDPKSQIVINIENLERLTINSSDKYSYEFPLSIIARNIKTIKWRGHPVDFSYLESFMSLENAAINIEPSCQHKSTELACRCKLLKSSIYPLAMLLQSIKHVERLKINIWPIEMFFMQNDEPIYFDNLERLILMVDDSFAEQVPVAASFLKGLPNLRTLLIKCEKSSSVLGNPNLINSLGLCPKSFNVLLNEDWIKIERITTQAAQDQQKSLVDVHSLFQV